MLKSVVLCKIQPSHLKIHQPHKVHDPTIRSMEAVLQFFAHLLGLLYYIGKLRKISRRFFVVFNVSMQ